MEDKMGLLDAASSPRRATLDDAVNLSKLFASAFMDDPLFDYMVRPGAGRAAALEMFFHEILRVRDIPQGEVRGADAFIIAAADTVMKRPSRELMAEVFPDVPIRGDLPVDWFGN